MDDGHERTSHQIMRDHLNNRRAGRLLADLDHNYADDIVVMSHLGHFQGRQAVETLARLLDEQLKRVEFFYESIFVDGPYAFLKWSAYGKDLHVSDGADSFVIRDGRICMQTIYYSLSTNPDARNTP